MAEIKTYHDYVDLANQEYNLTLEGATKDNLFTKISERGQRSKLARYFYNKTGFEISDLNHIVIAPKYGYMIQRLSYINNDLIGGVKAGIQSLNIDTSSEGKIVLRNKGAVGQIKLAYVFHSLAYALGIKIDTSKVDIYPVLNEALHDFEFLYFAPLNIARTITSENIDFINVVFITYNNRTYFDKVLLQSLANAMFNAGWFNVTKEIVSNVSGLVGGRTYSYDSSQYAPITVNDIREIVSLYMYNYIIGTDEMKADYISRIDTISNYLYNGLSADAKSGGHPFSIKVVQGQGFLDVYLYVFRDTNFEVQTGTPPADGIKEVKNNVKYGECWVTDWYSWYSNSGVNSTGGKYVTDVGYMYTYVGFAVYPSNLQVMCYSNLYTSTRTVTTEGITIIDGAKLPSGTDSLESDYPLWAQKLEQWTVTAIERLIEQEGEALRNLFLINDFLPLNIITGGIKYPEKKPGVPYEPIEVETYEVLLPEIIPPLPTNVVETLTLIPDEDDVVVDPKDPKTYEPIIDPKHPENYPPTNKYYYDIDVEINYPKDFIDPIGGTNGNPTNPTEPPSKNNGNISIPPKNPTDSVTSSRLFTVYNPTADQIDALGGYLWGESIAGTLASIFTNPLNAIISLHCIYCEPDVIGTREIRLGYLASGVSAKYVVSQYKEVDCGTIRIPEYYGDCRDYSPYTTINLFLPFIGFRPIKVDDVMGSELSIKYYVDVYTGACLACVSVNKGGVIQLTYNFDGNCSVMLPLTSGSWANMTVGLATALTSMIVNPVAGALQIPNAVHNGISMSSQGQMGSNVGAMGRKKPYVVITNTQAYDAVGYNELYGYPANILTKLSQLEGYTKVKEVHVENVNNATVDEKNEIERLLKSGVIIS